MKDRRARRHAIALHIVGFMERARYPADYEGVFQQDDEPMSPADALAFLTIEKAKGHKLVPMSAECGNPCPHAAQDCKGFDYAGSGCPGHLVEPDT